MISFLYDRLCVPRNPSAAQSLGAAVPTGVDLSSVSVDCLGSLGSLAHLTLSETLPALSVLLSSLDVDIAEQTKAFEERIRAADTIGQGIKRIEKGREAKTKKMQQFNAAPLQRDVEDGGDNDDNDDDGEGPNEKQWECTDLELENLKSTHRTLELNVYKIQYTLIALRKKREGIEAARVELQTKANKVGSNFGVGGTEDEGGEGRGAGDGGRGGDEGKHDV